MSTETEIKRLDDVENETFDYPVVQHKLLLLCQFVNDIQLEEFLSRIGTCEAISPMLNPILFMKGHKKLLQIKQLAVAALHFQKTVHEVKDLAGGH